MSTKKIQIIIEGATGRLGNTQHLKGLLAIRKEGGLLLKNGDRLIPEPVLLGRNADKLEAIAAPNHIAWSTDREACLADKSNEIYFDASVTAGRHQRAASAMRAGKHIYLEKPIAESLEEALDLATMAQSLGLKNGTVQDKLFLPSLTKLQKVLQSGYFGEIFSAKIDFGWWVFDGEIHPAQRSSWNYRKKDGGGLVLDMFPHWRYIVDTLLGEIKAVSCKTKTAVPSRRDEKGLKYEVDVDDTVMATLELANGALVEINASWASRIKRDDILTIQVDGSKGSAVCGLYRCFIQPASATPKPLWSIEVPTSENFDAQWMEVPDVGVYTNPYRCGWELFLKHVAENGAFPSPLSAGAKGIQLVDACYRSNAERRWIDLPDLKN
jgi:predicted dehydrogenase